MGEDHSTESLQDSDSLKTKQEARCRSWISLQHGKTASGMCRGALVSSLTEHALCAGVGDGEPVLPSEAAPGQRIRLPGQTNSWAWGMETFSTWTQTCVSLSLTIHAAFSIRKGLLQSAPCHITCTALTCEGCLVKCRVIDAPWRMPIEDIRAFFNYDMNLHKWREYCKRVEQYRLQYTMQVPCS